MDLNQITGNDVQIDRLQRAGFQWSVPEGEGEAGALGQRQDAVVAAAPLLIVPFLTRFVLIPKLYCSIIGN